MFELASKLTNVTLNRLGGEPRYAGCVTYRNKEYFVTAFMYQPKGVPTLTLHLYSAETLSKRFPNRGMWVGNTDALNAEWNIKYVDKGNFFSGGIFSVENGIVRAANNSLLSSASLKVAIECARLCREEFLSHGF